MTLKTLAPTPQGEGPTKWEGGFQRHILRSIADITAGNGGGGRQAGTDGGGR